MFIFDMNLKPCVRFSERGMIGLSNKNESHTAPRTRLGLYTP